MGGLLLALKHPCLDNIKTGKIVGALNQSTGAAFPWWAWLFIGLLVAVGGLLCLACLCCTQNKRGKRSKRLQDEKSRDIEAAAASAEARVPLTGAAASNNQKDLFDMLDKDGDGQLSQAELMAARQMFAAGSPTAAPAYRSGSMAAVAPQASVSVGPAVMLPPITVPPQAQPGHNYYVPVPAPVQVATGDNTKVQTVPFSNATALASLQFACRKSPLGRRNMPRNHQADE
ncbi:hypothetical protein AK812_SmicGene23409 [Symbiodinium microadriaticum]|uniref:EF-hand domain-containing protein n=1 Tax=Symbiodinium microadriaticum TaxID=2951 RepID=A0A1Q9DHB2_SYMMI|nr:hypothetical protein AK812_SmicGene23409 [Symbiodinium microadriaticum]